MVYLACHFKKVPSTGEEEGLLVVQSYDDLSRKLWRLEGLPLSITAVQGAHPALRYTQVQAYFLLTLHLNLLLDEKEPIFKSPSAQHNVNSYQVLGCFGCYF